MRLVEVMKLLALGTTVLLLATGCRKASDDVREAGSSSRSTPICAIQDCESHVVIDNGCTSDGRCLSCVNPCPETPVSVSSSPAGSSSSEPRAVEDGGAMEGSTHAVTTARDAIRRAVGPANAALDAAFARRRPAERPPHRGPWVTEDGAKVTGDAAHGFKVAWSHSPPAGFAYEVAVAVSAAGDARVELAKASFASK
jgi:hypothetical protein